MTREQTVDLVRSIVGIYPNWKPDNLTETVNAWHWSLEEYPAEAVKAALKIYIKTNNTGFAPSVSQLIGSMYKPQENERMTEGEAWHIVRKAIADSGYSAKEHFDEFTPEIQRAVGSPEILRKWGMMDSEEVNSVIMSNFQRTYRAVLEQEKFSEKIPPQLSQIVKELTEKTSAQARLEYKQGVE